MARSATLPKGFRRMTAMQLADYADKTLRLPEREVWHLEGGPLPKAALLVAIEREVARPVSEAVA